MTIASSKSHQLPGHFAVRYNGRPGKSMVWADYTTDQLLVSVSNLINAHAQTIKEENGWLGRIFLSSAMRADPDRVQMDGKRLILLLSVAHMEPPIKLEADTYYCVDLAMLKQILSEAKAQTEEI